MAEEIARREFLKFLAASPYVASPRRRRGVPAERIRRRRATGRRAKAVGIGRPFLWGLGAFGQAGVERVLEILQGELRLVMGNCGTRTVADITRDYAIVRT